MFFASTLMLSFKTMSLMEVALPLFLFEGEGATAAAGFGVRLGATCSAEAVLGRSGGSCSSKNS